MDNKAVHRHAATASKVRDLRDLDLHVRDLELKTPDIYKKIRENVKNDGVQEDGTQNTCT